jgi:hypothetical protein
LCGEIVSAGETYITDPRRRPIYRRRLPTPVKRFVAPEIVIEDKSSGTHS